MYIESQYAVAKLAPFPLIDFGATDFENTPVTFAAGDSKISKDGGAFANTTNLPTHEGNGIYSIQLTVAEMSAGIIVVTIIDTATKAWEDQSLIFQTINNASAEIPNKWADVKEWDSVTITGTEPPTAAANADAVWDEAVSGHQGANSFGNAFDDATIPELAAVASAARDAVADSLLKRDVDVVEATAPVHSFASMILKLVSRFKAGTGETFRTDGSTVHMTQTPTASPSADPVTELAVAV